MNSMPPIFTVTQLNRQVRNVLEFEVGTIQVEGEISNVTKPASGHYYFTLKDANAQIRCVYFKNNHASGLNQLEVGQQVVAGGKLSLYEARGDFQLIVSTLKEAGLGNLYQQFEALKIKLQAAGLFEASRKKPIPCFPNTIGIITSPTGAAIRDVLSTLARRFPLADIHIYPSDVQGKEAPGQLITAIQQANHKKQCDVLLLTRGGGSIEDLWAFNDEHLALAISHSDIPIVSGVGHETDFTIADFVADFRAATPTAAAESVTPNQQDLIARLNTLYSRLSAAIVRLIQHKRLLLSHQQEKITSPWYLIFSYWQTLDTIRSNLVKAIQFYLSRAQHRLQISSSQLASQNPKRTLVEWRLKLQGLKEDVNQAIDLKLAHDKQRLSHHKNLLYTLSPMATLERGYSITTVNEQVIFDANQVNISDEVHIRLSKGELITTVSKKQ
jgi:exodeoxyribonuclease VII large subunit